MMIIYRTINTITMHWYIGQDSKNNPQYLGSGLLLKKAIKKHGRKNFYKEILQQLPDGSTKDDLNKAEIFWINTMNAVNSENSYNLASGGSDVSTTPIVREKISKAMVGNNNGRANSKYTGSSNSQFGKKGRLHHLFGIVSPQKGIKHSTCLVLKNAISHGARPFKVYKKDGTFVGSWVCQSDCARALKLHNSAVSLCLLKQRKSHMGYVFEVVNE